MKDKRTVAQILGENIKRIRTEKGVSRKELAEKLGITEIAVGQYERGERQPQLDKIFEMSDLLDVPATDLTGGNQGFIEKEIFEYRFNRAMKMAKWANYFPEILSNGKVVMTIPNEIDHLENGVVVLNEGRDIEFKDKKSFVENMENAQGIALTFDLTFNEAMLLLQEQYRRKDQQKPKLTPNMQKIIRAVAEQEEAIKNTSAK